MRTFRLFECEQVRHESVDFAGEAASGDGSSDEIEQSQDQHQRPIVLGPRQVLVATLAITGVMACLIALLTPDAKRPLSAPMENFGPETTGLFETQQFNTIMNAHVRGLMDNMGVKEGQEHIAEHVAKATAHASEYMSKHLSSSEAQKLQNMRLSQDDWETVAKLLAALTDKRVQALGHSVIQEARANVLAGPAEIGKRVAARLQQEHVESLANELLPQNYRSALLQRWASATPSEDEIWKVMLDPTGKGLGQIRDTSTITIPSSALLGSEKLERSLREAKVLPKLGNALTREEVAEALARIHNSTNTKDAPARTLRDGPWAKDFTLNGVELALGITTVTFTTAAETLLHIDMIGRNFNIPYWAHAMLFVPMLSTGTVTCVVGLSWWCEYFLSALGINLLDGILILSGLNVHVGGKKAPPPPPALGEEPGPPL